MEQMDAVTLKRAQQLIAEDDARRAEKERVPKALADVRARRSTLDKEIEKQFGERRKALEREEQKILDSCTHPDRSSEETGHYSWDEFCTSCGKKVGSGFDG